MKVLFLIQSFIPKERHQDYFDILSRTINSIHTQLITDDDSFDIALCDDGSDYLSKYAENDIRMLDFDEISSIQQLSKLGLQYLALIANSTYYNKGELFNYVLKKIGNDYDIVFALDDDHPFVYNDSLQRTLKHFRNGYSFVVGRLYFPKDDKYRCYYDKAVQGTTFAISYKLLKGIGFWSNNVKKWGCGEDSEIFWKVYNYSCTHKIKAIYDGNIVTDDCISDRWLYCMNNLGGRDNFKISFKDIYGVDPHENLARNKKKWIDLEKNEIINLPEYFFLFFKKSDYDKIATSFFRFIIFWLTCSLKTLKFCIINIFRGVKNVNNR